MTAADVLNSAFVLFAGVSTAAVALLFARWSQRRRRSPKRERNDSDDAGDYAGASRDRDADSDGGDGGGDGGGD